MKIARNFELPDAPTTQTFALLTKRGAGKTYVACLSEMLEREAYLEAQRAA